MAGISDARTRGILKIQEGCNNFCSYCIIPYVRGRSRSRSLNDIVREAETMAQNGIREIVLTGIHIADYSSDGRGLSDVIGALDPLGVRIRLGSVEPGVLGEAFAQAAAKAKNLCPHFHISLQSGSAPVLSRMNRKYTPDEYMNFVSALHRHFDEPAITTDIIAGFPGETDAQHSETMRFVEQAGFARVHVFPFSAREGTAAFDMKPNVPKAVAKARSAELIALGEQSEAAYLRQMRGRVEQVLFEEPSSVFAGKMEGYSKRYFRVAADAQRNEIHDVALVDICDTIMLGEKT